jgi:hypothetical protein
MSQIIQELNYKLAEDISADGFEITTETAPAEDHEFVQGKIFLAAEFEKLQAHEPATDTDGEVHILSKRNIGQYNCRHRAYPFFNGISERNHDQEDLQKIYDRNHSNIKFDGEKHTLYELTQTQRQIEVELRRTRGAREIIYQVGGADPAFRQDLKDMDIQIKGLRNDYDRLGRTLEPYGIIKKPGRTYNINARGNR